MRSGNKIFLLGIITLLVLATSGCRVRAPLPLQPGILARGGPSYQSRARYQYHYFPEAQVYFDTSRNLYFYLSDDLWLSAPLLPSRIHLDLNNPVTLELDGPKPFVHHRDTSRRYPPGLRKEKPREPKERLNGKREERGDRRESREDRREEQQPEKERKGKKKKQNKKGEEDDSRRPAIWK